MYVSGMVPPVFSNGWRCHDSISGPFMNSKATYDVSRRMYTQPFTDVEDLDHSFTKKISSSEWYP
jgi:hypothetical protein